MEEKTNKKIKLSTESYKGVRDFYPEDMFIQNHIFGVMEKISKNFGFVEYDASVLESTEIYEAKSGEEIVNEQTYTFEDRGGRSVTLRPEMTPTIARMVAAKRRELAFPLRWYSIPNMFRYERPQRGRLREHWQLNVDLFGLSSIDADVEIISLGYYILKEFGANDSQFEIRLNSRKLIDRIYKYYGLSDDEALKVSKLIDKKDKMEKNEFKTKLYEILEDKGDVAGIFFDFLSENNFKALPEKIQECEEKKELDKTIDTLKNVGISNVMFDSSIMRGFDYYTGVVFEVSDTHPENRKALFGGGRYDNLLEVFGNDKVPAVGFGMGDVRLQDFLRTHGLLPRYTPPTDLYICTLPDVPTVFVHNFAKQLRMQGINVAVDWSERKIGDQAKAADKLGIEYFVCLGTDEMDSSKFKIKNLKTGTEKSYSNLKKIVKLLKK